MKKQMKYASVASIGLMSVVFLAGCSSTTAPAPIGSSDPSAAVSAAPTSPVSPLVTPEVSSSSPTTSSSSVPTPVSTVDATGTSQQPVYVEAPEVVVMDQALTMGELSLSTHIGRPIVLLTMTPKDWKVASMSPEGIVEFKEGKKKGNSVLNPSLTAVSPGETTVVMKYKDGSTVTFNIVTTDKA